MRGLSVSIFMIATFLLGCGKGMNNSGSDSNKMFSADFKKLEFYFFDPTNGTEELTIHSDGSSVYSGPGGTTNCGIHPQAIEGLKSFLNQASFQKSLEICYLYGGTVSRLTVTAPNNAVTVFECAENYLDPNQADAVDELFALYKSTCPLYSAF